MNKREGKIWLWILLGIIVIVIVVVVLGFLFLKGQDAIDNTKEKVKSRIESGAKDKFEELVGPMLKQAREKLMGMLPNDYDKQKAEKDFNNFFSSLKVGNVRKDMLMKEFIPYLQYIISDKEITHEEADSLFKLMDNAILK